MGITHEVFREPEAAEGAGDEEGAEEGSETIKKNTDDILQTYRHIYVKEVVREPKMHFYTVPRLGAFMAVPLEYNSCLSEGALEAAVQDFLGMEKAVEDQEKFKLEWEEEQNRLREEKEKAGEPFVPEEKEWEPIEEKPFVSKKKSFVVCLDTLGQDREFTEEQRRFVLNTVKRFRELWEQTE